MNVSMKDVAEKLGISQSTVSLALNNSPKISEATKEKVKAAADGLLPILAKAEKLGSKVGIYNHGGWAGEPENMVAVCEYLQTVRGEGYMLAPD